MRFSIPAVLLGALCVLEALCVLGASSAMRTASAAEEAPHAPARTAPRATEERAHPSPVPTRPSEAPRTAPGRSLYVPQSAPPRAAYPTGVTGAATRPTGAATRPRMNNGLALDARYNHGRYYAPVGTVTRVLPPDHRPYYLHGRRYYYSSGVWYATRGVGFAVVAAPVGIVLPSLPPFCTTVWYGGVPYYYADNTYYAWQPDQSGYAVVDPPDGSSAAPPDGGGAPDAASSDSMGEGAPPVSSNADFVIYPKNGQSKDQQAADEYDCGNWSRSQTGFDPSLPDGGVMPEDSDRSHSNYDRAMAACLQGRGYQLN